MTLELLIGLPGSGKTTYARRRLAEAVDKGGPGSVAVVSFETLRREVFGCGYVPELDELVYPMFYEQLRLLLLDRRVVLVDNMNLRRLFRDRCARIARQHGHRVIATEIRTDPEECWRRVVARGVPFRGGREAFDLLVQRREQDCAMNGTSGVDEWIEVACAL